MTFKTKNKFGWQKETRVMIMACNKVQAMNSFRHQIKKKYYFYNQITFSKSMTLNSKENLFSNLKLVQMRSSQVTVLL